jgi:hypothetical protein
MSAVFQKHYEKVFLGVGAAALLASAGWTWRQHQALSASQAEVTTPILRGGVYAATAISPANETAATWRKAPVQSAGSGWVYELFTPPVIYYNATARSFAVTAPDGAGREVTAAWGAQLLAVRLEPYRLQLTGYFGSADDYVAAFAVPGSSEVVLARAGRRFGQLGLTLKSFEVRKMRLDHNDPWPVYDVAGVATLLDERTGTEVELDSRTRKLTDTLMAVMKMPGRGKPRELHEGDTWAEGEIVYRIERIQLEPAEVVVTRNVPGLPLPEIRTMHPLAAKSGQGARQPGGRNQSTSHPRNVANNGP